MNEFKRNWVYCWEENHYNQKVYRSLKTIRDKNNHWTSGLMRCESCGIVKDFSQPTKKTSEIMKMKKQNKTKNQVIVVPTGKKTTPKTKSAKKTTPSPALISVKKTKNPVLYFQCMSDCCQKGLKGQKITQIAHECKVNSPALITQRTKEVKELQKALGIVSKFAKNLETVLINSH